MSAVYDLVTWWAAEGRDVERARRALWSRRLDVSEREDPFAAIIRCTAHPAKVDKRTRSKWSRVMRYVTAVKDQAEPFQQFVKRKGGINRCASRFTRLLKRQTKAARRGRMLNTDERLRCIRHDDLKINLVNNRRRPDGGGYSWWQ